jgi:excisionase family DNA binding protein
MNTTVQERQLLTVPEVAVQLRVSERTVRRLIDRGLPAVQLGGPGASVRVDVCELKAWLYGDAARSFLLSPAAAENLAERRVPVPSWPAVEARPHGGDEAA